METYNMQNEVVTDGYELSPQQTRIWLLQQADGSHAYKAQSAVLMEGMIDVETLKTAISEVVARHEILHINFHLLPGMRLPLQTIKPDQVIEFREIDLNEFDLQEKQTRFEELFRKEARHRFDLRYEPIARFCLVRLSISERVLVTNLPSVCVDSRSLKNLFREIARTYSACLRGEKLSDRPIQYVDFAEWQEEILGEEQADDLDERWDRQNPYLCSPSQLMLGVELDSRLGFGFDPDYISFTLDPEITIKIDRISSIHNISSDVFLLACWQILIWRFTGRKDIAIDNLCEGRSVKELWESLGTFARFCPIQSHLEPSYQFTDVFEIADQSLWSANERFNHIPRRDSRLINDGFLAERANAIGFEYEEWPRVEYAGSVKFSYWRQHCCIDRFKLKLGGYLKAEGLTIELHYDTAIFSRASIVLIGERYLRLIESAVEGVQTLIGNYEGRQDEYLKVNGYQIEDAIRAGEKNERQLLVKVSREGRLPLSFAQQRLWFIDQLEPGGAIYNVPTALRVRGELRRELLESALGEVVRRHEALRTRFEIREGQPAQIIDQASPVGAPVIDVSGLEEGQREKEARRIAGEEATRGFDLGRGPLLRARILRLGEQDQALLFTMHHIVSDEWSRGVLINEVNRLYEAYGRGESSPLEELPIQYADYAAWQRGWLRGEALDRQVGYWREQLEGVEALELPTDYRRPVTQSYEGAGEGVLIPAETLDRLRELGRREGVTMFMLLMSAFKILLHRYSGQEQIVVGTPIAGRNRLELEPLIGFFVNMLAIKTDLAGGPSVREAIGREREAALGAYAHQDVPVEKIVEELQPERDLSRHPIFQVTFVYEKAAEERVAAENLRLSEFGTGFTQAQYDLGLTMVEGARGLAAAVGYCRALFDGVRVRRMLWHLRMLLEGMAEDADRKVGQIEILSESEKAQILSEWNDTQVAYPGEKRVHELFEQQVELTPDAVAAICEGEQLTYQELDRRADQLAQYLMEKGVDAEQVVGICLDRSLEMLVGLLGILKSGGAFLPLEPQSPPQRLVELLEDCSVKVMLTELKLSEKFRPWREEKVELDMMWEAIAAGRGERRRREVGGENLAYVIYTSGSSGKAKGAMITHRGLSDYCQDVSRRLGLGSGDRFYQFASLGFDVMVEEIFPGWVSGAAIVLGGGENLESVEEMEQRVQREQVSMIEVPTAYWEQWARVIAGRSGTRVKSLRKVIVGGERMDTGRISDWEMSGKELVHVYGLSETTVTTSLYEVKERAGVEVPIGRPIGNTQVYILDRNQRIVGEGIAGEIHIGGEGVGRGYWGEEALTAERYVPNPYGEGRGERLYRTGDIGRWLRDGNIEFIGRRDEQVKIRGYRIELGEIETRLAEHAAVAQAAVMAREEAGGKRLVAYVVMKDGEASRVSELREYLKERLPDYMAPGVYVRLERLPLTANGKVDKKALPQPDEAGRELDESYQEPRTEVEEVMAGIWRQVLGVERVGTEDNFFELGGHSLLATRVVSRIREVFKVELPLRTIFEEERLAGLSRRVEAELRAGAGLQIPPIERASREESLPPSFAQQRLWFIDQLEPGGAMYNILSALWVRGELRREPLESALGEVVRRHEALRTRFELRGGQPAQIIDLASPVAAPVIDVRGLEERQKIGRAHV